MPIREDPRNSDDPSLIGSVASGLATLHGHGDQAREIGRLLQQVSLARKQSKGALAELLWATENFLSSVSSGSLAEENGSYDVLKDLSQYLFSTSAGKGTVSLESDAVDELLERLDFLASGGMDREVPKSTSKAQTPPIGFTSTQLPVHASTSNEDPLLINSLEQARSTCRLLISQLAKREDEQFQELTETHQQHLRAIEARIYKESCTSLKDIVNRLTNLIKDNFESQSPSSRNELSSPTENSDRIFKSLANFLTSVIEDIVKWLVDITDNRVDASIEIETLLKSDHLVLVFSLKGIKSKYVELLKSANEQVELKRCNEATDYELESTQETKPTTKKIQTKLRALRKKVRFLGGALVIRSEKRDEITIEATINRLARITQMIPVTIHSDRFALDAHLVRAVVPASTASCDTYKKLVTHENIFYEYDTLGFGKRIDQLDSKDLGFIVLMDCGSRKLALYVDAVHDVEPVVVRQSGSLVEFGNNMSLSPSNMLFVDLMSLPRSQRQTGQFKRASLCLLGVTRNLAETFLKATMNIDIECNIVHEIADAIRMIQERRPRFLVLQSLTEESHCLDQLRLFRRDVDLSSLQVVIATSAKESHEPLFESEYSELKWIDTDISVRDLSDLIASNLDSQELS